MKAWKRLLASAASVLGITVASEATVWVSPSSAATEQEIAELECQRALEQNTIEALEGFVQKYGDYDTSCTALALEALNNFGNRNDSDTSHDGPDDGYVQ